MTEIAIGGVCLFAGFVLGVFAAALMAAAAKPTPHVPRTKAELDAELRRAVLTTYRREKGQTK